MNKLITAIFLTAASALILESPGWWWAMPIAGLIGGWLVKRGGKGFIVGGLGVTLIWAAFIVFFAISSPLGSLLQIFSGILGLDSALAFVPILLALIVAFLLGGLGGLTGGWLMESRA